MPRTPDRPTPDYLIVSSLDGFEKVRPPESATSFTVRDASNPYREALLEGGVMDPTAIAERKDIALDLAHTLEADSASYRAANLPDWASALDAIKADLRLTPEKRTIIEQELKDGAIPILMPGRAIQLATTAEQLTQHFKPVWIKNSATEILNETYLWEHLKALIDRKAAELVEGVPERPYIQLTKPTQKPEPRTTNKTVDQQKQELLAINTERQAQGKPPAHVTNPFEYAALQTRFTQRVQDSAGAHPLTTLNPPDSTTWSRFINLPVSSDGDVPGADFNPVIRQLKFGRGNAADPDPGGGFRLSMRVEV